MLAQVKGEVVNFRAIGAEYVLRTERDIRKQPHGAAILGRPERILKRLIALAVALGHGIGPLSLEGGTLGNRLAKLEVNAIKRPAGEVLAVARRLNVQLGRHFGVLVRLRLGRTVRKGAAVRIIGKHRHLGGLNIDGPELLVLQNLIVVEIECLGVVIFPDNPLDELVALLVRVRRPLRIPAPADVLIVILVRVVGRRVAPVEVETDREGDGGDRSVNLFGEGVCVSLFGGIGDHASAELHEVAGAIGGIVIVIDEIPETGGGVFGEHLVGLVEVDIREHVQRVEAAAGDGRRAAFGRNEGCTSGDGKGTAVDVQGAALVLIATDQRIHIGTVRGLIFAAVNGERAALHVDALVLAERGKVAVVKGGARAVVDPQGLHRRTLHNTGVVDGDALVGVDLNRIVPTVVEHKLRAVIKGEGAARRNLDSVVEVTVDGIIARGRDVDDTGAVSIIVRNNNRFASVGSDRGGHERSDRSEGHREQCAGQRSEDLGLVHRPPILGFYNPINSS